MSDTERFEAIYRAHLGHVLAYARRRLGSAEEAEEVAAETFTVAWRRLDELPREPLAWLYGVARHALMNHRRGERRHAALIREIAHDHGMRAGALADDLSPAVATQGRLPDAMAALEADEREALRLVAWEDLTHRQAAAVMGLSRVGFTRLSLRARRQLARRLDGDHRETTADALNRPSEGSSR